MLAKRADPQGNHTSSELCRNCLAYSAPVGCHIRGIASAAMFSAMSPQ